MKRTVCLVGAILLTVLAWKNSHRATDGDRAPAAPKPSPLLVRYFRIPVCHKCDELEEGILKDLSRHYGGAVRITVHDLSREDDYLLLTRLERELGVSSNQPAVVVVGNRHFAGGEAIREGLEKAVEETMTSPLRLTAEPAAPRRSPNTNGLSPDTLLAWMKEGKPMRLIGLPCGDMQPEEKLPGAVVLRSERVEVEARAWDRKELIVLYCCRCGGDTPGACGPAIVSLRALGFENVFYLQGHLQGWRAMGYDVEPVLSPR